MPSRRWPTPFKAGHIVLAWVITLPMAALVVTLVYRCLASLLG